MYYGRTITEMAPLYVDETIKSVAARKKKISELEKNAEALKQEFEHMADSAEKFQKQAAYENERKKCNMEFLNLVQIIGGFYSVDSTGEAEQLLLEKFKTARNLRTLQLENLSGETEKAVLMLTRMMCAAASLEAVGKSSKIDKAAFSKDASLEAMERGIISMEQAAGEGLRKFDAIGLSFPDVVIQNLIVGGETFKTKGMRENKKLDYEEQFGKISVLCEDLKAFVTEDGAVMNTNDGPMAAFTAAVERAWAGEDVSNGFFAHTLGTELGTGWVLPDGSIPEIPLEVYNFIIDLGSCVQKQYPSNDVRSISNYNTNLPGTLQKYTCQSGVFRLAMKYLPEEEPEIYQEALERGLFFWDKDEVIVPTEPKDMRKPCLEFFMKKAGESESCGEIFRKVGEYLAVTWEETDYILNPAAKERSLFGRLVKSPVCFRLMCEGAGRRKPDLKQYAADGGLANTDLMKQLEAHPDYTVAQFAQAVGAIYFGCLGLRQE